MEDVLIPKEKGQQRPVQKYKKTQNVMSHVHGTVSIVASSAYHFKARVGATIPTATSVVQTIARQEIKMNSMHVASI